MTGHDDQQRQDIMQRDVLLVATAACSLLAGQSFSPYFDPAFFLLRPFIAGTYLATPLIAFYITSLFVSLMALLIAGVPAALYERARRLGESSPVSLGIWFVATSVISLPALLGLFRAP